MPRTTTPTPSHRRLLRRLALLALPAFALLCSLAVVRPHSAQAFAEWCFDDPIVSFNGIQMHTTIGVLGRPNQVTHDISSTTIVYSVPAGVTTQLIMNNSSFLHTQVQFVTSDAPWTPGQPIPVTVTVSMQSGRFFVTQMLNTQNVNLLAWDAGTSDTGMTSSFLLTPAYGRS